MLAIALPLLKTQMSNLMSAGEAGGVICEYTQYVNPITSPLVISQTRVLIRLHCGSPVQTPACLVSQSTGCQHSDNLADTWRHTIIR